jgi:hypothetical protein
VFDRLAMARTKQTARKSVGDPHPTKVRTEEVGSVPPGSVPSVTPSSTTTVEERDGQTASGGKRKCDGTRTTRWTGKRVVFVVGGKRGEPIQM